MAAATATKPRKKLTEEQKAAGAATKRKEREAEAKVLIPEIKKEHEAVVDALTGGLEHSKKCGDLLLKAKALIKGKMADSWGDWIETNCPFSHRSAINYMRIAKEWDQLKVKKTISTRAAIRFLKEGRPAAKPRGATSAGGNLKGTITRGRLSALAKEHNVSSSILPKFEALLEALGVTVKQGN